MVWKLDESVGRVMQALDEKGILGNAIVVFVSDNGASTVGIHRNHGSNWPLKGVRSWNSALQYPWPLRSSTEHSPSREAPWSTALLEKLTVAHLSTTICT
jgi:arylsulfatase A-like enzyme